MDSPYDTIKLALRTAAEYGPLGMPAITRSEYLRAMTALDLVRLRSEAGDFPGWSSAREGAAMDALAALLDPCPSFPHDTLGPSDGEAREMDRLRAEQG